MTTHADGSDDHSGSSSGGPAKIQMAQQHKIFDDKKVTRGYDSVPLIEIDTLPRGGISLETAAVGRIQFGIPPETIKDSMLLGMEVPSVYIVPVERFCREMGPALGINLAEFEFPAYFNYFVKNKRCTLVVDSSDAEEDIRCVFGETLLGPRQFRDHCQPCGYVNEDFDPSFPVDARPNFYKEFLNFRTAEESTGYQELTIDTLLQFCHFRKQRRPQGSDGASHGSDQTQSYLLGVPPMPPEFELDEMMNDKNSSRSRRRLSLIADSSSDEYLGAISEDNAPTAPSDVEPPMPRRNSNPNLASPQIVSKSARRDSMSSDARSEDSVSFNGDILYLPGIPPPNSLKRNSTDVGPGSSGRIDRRGSMGRRDSIGRRDSMGRRDSIGRRTSMGRRDSLRSRRDSITSSRISEASYTLDYLMTEDNSRPDSVQENSSWMYSQAKWLGEVATIYPPNTTEEQKRSNKVARVEIFKMAGGTEYIVHDVNDRGIICGKATFSGTVSVPDVLSVQGFIAKEQEERMTAGDANAMQQLYESKRLQRVCPSTFHPPSFGVTVLGNSHGFDKNGSTSGYVLWVNGRGIMIDPPPYSSATLEREGIRPQMIMGCIITHCHADHDAGAFQKVMTGARIAIITTPTIYKSFIRKYAALSGLRPTLLRHSHRHRPAIIGQPLRFQGAVFHFTYTLHTIPCLSFKVTWRGRSIVFTGDHLNSPPVIDRLERENILTKGRADDLRHLPIQDCDILLHEAGAPPIHTPLKVLEELPQHVRDRLYVVHTATLPNDCTLRVAPTGTAGTIRLDSYDASNIADPVLYPSATPSIPTSPAVSSPHDDIAAETDLDGVTAEKIFQQSRNEQTSESPPLVLLRPTCVSDAWFILNLLSAVPFFRSLSYSHTLEILEIARVDTHKAGDIVMPGPERTKNLCLIWEGACVEHMSSLAASGNDSVEFSHHSEGSRGLPKIWYAGDWEGPISLQPNTRVDTTDADRLDIMAVSPEGVKAIKLAMKDLHRILKIGSKLYRKYLTLQEKQTNINAPDPRQRRYDLNFSRFDRADSLMDVLQCNSVLDHLSALQKRHLESLAEGPRRFEHGDYLWKVGDPVNYAYLIVSGSSSLGRNEVVKASSARMNRRGSTGGIGGAGFSRRAMRFEPLQLDVPSDKLLRNVHPNSEYARLEVSLQLRAEERQAEVHVLNTMKEYDASTLSLFKADAARENRDRFANKVLARLYSRRAYTLGLVFSRGMLLSDVSRMVSGDLANINRGSGDSSRLSIGSGNGSFSGTNGNDQHRHTSNLVAGPDGCVVMVFPRATLVTFLDNNPGVLLCLLGTQAVI